MNSGAFAFSLSGAGSTIIAYVSKENSESVCKSLQRVADESNLEGKAVILKPCTNGAICEIS